MKCPRCGAEMTLDSHRKIPLNMCYECGYIEGRSLDGDPALKSNYSHLKGLSLTETAAFLTAGLSSVGVEISESVLVNWLTDPVK